MTGFELATVALVPVVIGAGIVGARWLAGKVMDRIERGEAEADERLQSVIVADAAAAPFGELDEVKVRAVMTRRRALVIDANDFEGRN